jgi:hypothetical protein
MFASHQPIIGDWARRSPDNFRDVLRFVIATVQQSIETVPDIVADFRTLGSESRFAFDWKARALDYYAEHGETVHGQALAIWEAHKASPGSGAAELTGFFAELPGFGLVKGGFVVQMVFGVSACLDSHNMARFGVNPGRYSAAAYKGLKKPESKAARAAEYVALCNQLGGSAGLWDSWCDYVASLRPDTFESGFDVSRIHVDALGADLEAMPF